MKSNSNPRVIIYFCSAFFIFITGCKKLVEIPPPVSTIPTSQVFSTNDEATSAIDGVYYSMINYPSLAFGNGAVTIFCGLSSDEFLLSDLTYSDADQFYNNTLTSYNGLVAGDFWSEPFSIIYQTNAILEGVQNSADISDSVKNEIKGEAKFLRAFVNFYLVNLFGDIPYLTTTNWRKTSLAARMNTSEVYANIVSDLKDAESLLSNDYSIGHGERILPNKWAATALLSRVYLYQKDWGDAARQASAVINSGLFKLESDLNNVFRVNSTEAILQLKQDSSVNNYNGTFEGSKFIPIILPYFKVVPYVSISDSLLNSFSPNDKRKLNWIDSSTISGHTYFFPYKYKIGLAQQTTNGTYTEYYMVLRLAEQYLNRAEANAEMGQYADAISDLNIIRNRAGVITYSGPQDNKDSVLSAIYHERRLELFAEWGNRWLDLKRWGSANEILSVNKGFSVENNSLLYPIPAGEINLNPNLIQNPGY